MDSHTVPGALRIDSDHMLRVGRHVGWLETEVGLYSWTGEVTVAPKRHLTDPDDAAIVDPAARIDAKRYPHLAQAARGCPVVVIPDGHPHARAFEFAWRTSVNHGTIVDVASGRRFEGELDRYLLSPMSPEDVSLLVQAAKVEGDDEWNAWLEGEAAAHLARGDDSPEVREELDRQAGPSIDRIVRALSSGLVDEDAIELAMQLTALVEAGGRDDLKDWEHALATHPNAGFQSEELLGALASLSPRVETPWGPAFRIVRPKVVMLCGLFLPAEPARYFPQADPLGLDDEEET